MNAHCELLEKFLMAVPRGKAGMVRRAATDTGRRWQSMRDANGRVTAARDMANVSIDSSKEEKSRQSEEEGRVVERKKHGWMTKIYFRREREL